VDQIKRAFQDVKQDIDILKQEVSSLRNSMVEIRQRTIELSEIMVKLYSKITPTHQDQNKITPTLIPTHNNTLKPLNDQILGISTGNGGVPTDRQTDQQTDRHIGNTLISPQNYSQIPPSIPVAKFPENTLNNASKILESLDNLKKELRLKFKRLTSKEILVFSALYQLDEEQGHSDYRMLANRLNLTESSIRDYIGKLIQKGIPVEKKRINNKTIHLTVSEGLKKMASLSTILKLRDI
jgi:DNA-binding MarR family transcriptional regulator